MQQKPWHHSPAIIVGLLVLFPPAGIALMWMRLPWTHKAKLGVSAVAGAWFVAMLVGGSARNRRDAIATQPTGAVSSEPPRATPASLTSPPAPVTQVPSGRALIEREPLLLIPPKLDGFALAVANPLPPKIAVGATASYIGENKHLVAHVTVNKSDVKPDPPDEQRKPIKVGESDALLAEDKSDKTISITWNTAGWHVLVTVDYERSTDRSAAEKAVNLIAPEIGAVLDKYLAGTAPTEAAREQHLAEIAQATSTTRAQAFVTKLEGAGIGRDLVSNVSLKGDPDELLITVGPSWHRAIRQERLMAAQNLWKMWADINTPTTPDTSRIKLVDANGNEVGGSGLGAGSRIKVQD
ncbi:MAG: hypothetical protein K8M05_18960 [Deltaproteobacteria bacterium]|nr:hypothetical protein [Kofleriaceae bacterium]